ncbi:hypothetical protein C8R44DRAFT_871652 [Mycena epipterygia]|nr:hypothetical protein C8R44DRAFT_871652 [Mycena epipterygia]
MPAPTPTRARTSNSGVWRQDSKLSRNPSSAIRRRGRFLRQCVFDALGRRVGARRETCAVLLCTAIRAFPLRAIELRICAAVELRLCAAVKRRRMAHPALLIFTLRSAAGVLIVPAAELRARSNNIRRTTPKSSSPVHYDRGTPVGGVSFAVFPPVPLSSHVSLSSSSSSPFSASPSDARPGHDARMRSAGAPVRLRHTSRALGLHLPRVRHTSPSHSTYTLSSPHVSSPHVKLDLGVGHDRAPPPSSNSYSTSSSPSSPAEETRVGYDRGTHRTETRWSGKWVTHSGGGRMQSMDNVAKRLRGLCLR